MKATELLRNQHQQVDTLFEQIEGAEGKESRPLIEELAAMLVGHALIEQELFYPLAEEGLGAANEIRRSYEEHALVEYTLQKLLRTESSDPSFHARVSVLRELVQRHVREEEDDLIPRVDREIDEDRLEDLGEQMEARFEEVVSKDVKTLLASEVRKATPRTTTRGAAKKGAPRRGAVKQPARAKRGTAAATTQRAKPARGAAAKGARPVERKKAAAPSGGSGRTGSTRGGSKATTRGGGAKSTRGNARKGRSSSAQSR